MASHRTIDVDLAIIGGGCAGLSLAMRLASDPDHSPRVVVIEPRSSYSNDRTWAFWEGAPAVSDLAGLVAKRWHRWKMSSARRVASQFSTRPYVAVPSNRFYEHAQRCIEHCSRVELHLGTQAQGFVDQGSSVSIETDRGSFRAEHVVDTRPPDARQLSNALLFQAFAGAEVISEWPVFDPATVDLMADLSVDADGLCFTYTLPYSPTHGLVEVTRFAPAPAVVGRLDNDLEIAIERLEVPVTIHRRERGLLPMGLPATSPALDTSRLVSAGTGAGACRPATGYAFVRIQRWADACAKRILRGGPPLAHPPDAAWARLMDDLFLRVLRERPELGPELFLALAERVPAERFIRFLSDEASLLDIASVIRALPPGPFMNALISAPSRALLASSTRPW